MSRIIVFRKYVKELYIFLHFTLLLSLIATPINRDYFIFVTKKGDATPDITFFSNQTNLFYQSKKNV